MSDAPRSPWFSRWDLLPLAAALALAVALPVLLKGLPDPLPTHFDAHGRANGWTAQSAFPWLGFGLPAFVWALLLLIGRAFVGSDQDPDGRKSEAMAPLRGLLAFGMLLLMGATLLIPRIGFKALWIALALFLVLLVLGIALMVRELKRVLPDDGQGACYRWGGVFYVNPDDPAIWVPKRFGLGWTLNFAHPASWWLLALLLLPCAVILIVSLTR